MREWFKIDFRQRMGGVRGMMLGNVAGEIISEKCAGECCWEVIPEKCTG